MGLPFDCLGEDNAPLFGVLEELVGGIGGRVPLFVGTGIGNESSTSICKC